MCMFNISYSTRFLDNLKKEAQISMKDLSIFFSVTLRSAIFHKHTHFTFEKFFYRENFSTNHFFMFTTLSFTFMSHSTFLELRRLLFLFMRSQSESHKFLNLLFIAFSHVFSTGIKFDDTFEGKKKLCHVK
jgi:hypothetical protein